MACDAVATTSARRWPLAAAFAAAEGLERRRVLHVSSGAARKITGLERYCATKARSTTPRPRVQLDAVPGCASARWRGVIDTGMQAEIRASTSERFPLRDRFAEIRSQRRSVNPAEVRDAPGRLLLDGTSTARRWPDLRDLGR